jgi:hypothetical protein
VGEIQRVTGREEGQKEEALHGSGKGMTFEDNVYGALAEMAKGYDDASENTQGTVGTIPRSKVGDAIVTLGPTCSAKGTRIVFEFKMDKGYKLKHSQDEMATARRNRSAQIGVMVFAEGYEPDEIGNFRRIGEDIFCTANAEGLNNGEKPIFVEAAYQIARGMAVVASKKDTGGINIESLRSKIEALLALCERLAEIATKAQTVQNAGEAITKTVGSLQTEMKKQIGAVQEMIRDVLQEAA